MLALTRSSRKSRLAGLLLGLLAAACGMAVVDRSARAVADTDAAAIVERADRIRFPDGGFQADITITSTAPGRTPDVREYRVLNKGHDNSLVMTLSPASERGTVLLMKETDLWVFVPSVSQPVRLPLSHKLTGQVANGDLARANFAGDYTPTLLGTETIDGREYHKLELTAARKGVTYHRVLYWVAVSDNRPFKAEFYSVSKRLMKTCHYQEFKEIGGAVRPSRMVMDDAVKQGEQSVMDYVAITSRELDDKVFTKEYLKKLQ